MRRATLLRTTRAVLIGLVLDAAVAALGRNWTEVSATLANLEVRTWLPVSYTHLTILKKATH